MALQRKKTFIRKAALQKRLGENRTRLQKKSGLVCNKLEKLPAFKKSKTVLAYIPIKNEVDILPIIKKSFKKKKILLLKTSPTKKIFAKEIKNLDDISGFQPKPYCKTISKKNIDLFLIPGLAFSTNGHRIGFGKGHFDQYLKRTKGKKIGIAYDFQILNNMPVEGHDQKMNIIVTDKKTIII